MTAPLDAPDYVSPQQQGRSIVDTKKVSLSVTYTLTEVRDDQGDLIGTVVPVAVPGLPDDEPLVPRYMYMGWAHDWDADNPTGQYSPLCLGVAHDEESLIAEIAERARDAQEEKRTVTEATQNVHFYAGNNGPRTLRIETEGVILNLTVGQVDADQRPVTSVHASPDDETRGGDMYGHTWRLTDDGVCVVRDTPLTDNEPKPHRSRRWSLVTSAEDDLDFAALQDIAEAIRDGVTGGTYS
jgi:hypothetical protein